VMMAGIGGVLLRASAAKRTTRDSVGAEDVEFTRT
jgi:hypothetical protein